MADEECLATWLHGSKTWFPEAEFEDGENGERVHTRPSARPHYAISGHLAHQDGGGWGREDPPDLPDAAPADHDG